MTQKNYDRIRAVLYARKWAFSRNPAYFSFNQIGGDCTNFVSQYLYAGSTTSVMENAPDENNFPSAIPTVPSSTTNFV